MNQIIAALMLFGVVTAVFAPLIADSGLQIFARSSSIRDSMEDSRVQSGQALVATHIQQRGGNMTIFISNIGIEDIRIHTILIDGYETPHLLKNQDENVVSLLEPGNLGSIEAASIGERIQAITEAGKLFDFSTV